MAEQIASDGTYIHAVPSKLRTRLVRNHDMVHLRTCARVATKEVTPWQWAEGKPREEILAAMANGLHFCRACDPLLHVEPAMA